MERIRQKIGRIREHISLIESIKDDCIRRFVGDPLYRGALLHYLYLLADSCITLAEMVIRHKQLRPPQNYQEAFDILGENRILDPDFAFDFARIAGFRNFLAHDYEKIDGTVICREILAKLGDAEKFVRQIEEVLGIRSQ